MDLLMTDDIRDKVISAAVDSKSAAIDSKASAQDSRKTVEMLIDADRKGRQYENGKVWTNLATVAVIISCIWGAAVWCTTVSSTQAQNRVDITKHTGMLEKLNRNMDRVMDKFGIPNP